MGRNQRKRKAIREARRVHGPGYERPLPSMRVMPPIDRSPHPTNRKTEEPVAVVVETEEQD